MCNFSLLWPFQSPHYLPYFVNIFCLLKPNTEWQDQGEKAKSLMHTDISQRPDISHCCILTASIMLITDKAINKYILDEWQQMNKNESTAQYSYSESISSVQFSCSVVSDSLRPHELQHARPPCPSPTPRVHWDSRPSSQWCYPVISWITVKSDIFRW